MTTSTRLVWLAVGAVVLFVSLSRLHVFAVYENERDALRVLQLLGPRAVAAAESSLDPGTDGLRGLLESAADELSRLSDAEWLAPEALPAGDDAANSFPEPAAETALRRHGYLFGLRRDARGRWCLLAWPWSQGRTGVAAFVFHPELGLLGHPNREAHWSGLEPEAAPLDIQRWIEVTPP